MGRILHLVLHNIPSVSLVGFLVVQDEPDKEEGIANFSVDNCAEYGPRKEFPKQVCACHQSKAILIQYHILRKAGHQIRSLSSLLEVYVLMAVVDVLHVIL